MVYNKSDNNTNRIERLEKQVAALTEAVMTLRDIVAKQTDKRPFEILDISSFDYWCNRWLDTNMENQPKTTEHPAIFIRGCMIG